MKKSKRIILTLIPVLFVLCIMFMMGNSIFATSPISPNLPGTVGNGGSIDTVNNAVGKVWGTVTLVLQIVAIAAIVIAGVRYMFASADSKADIKKQTVILVVGAVLVFGATSIVQFITAIVSQTIPNT